MTGRFSAAPIGPALLTVNGGLVLTHTADALDLARSARSDVAQASGAHGVEFAFWGEGDQLPAAVGILQPGASLDVMVGADHSGIGWRLDTGEIYSGNALLASGLPIVAKGEIVGVRIDIEAGTVEFHRGDAIVHARSHALAGGAWHFAVSMGSTEAGDLACAVNAGQWQAAGAAALTGWRAPAASIGAVRLADVDWLTAGTDTPAHARYEGIIDAAGLATVAEIGFWPWGGDVPMQGGAAQVTVLDSDGLLDPLAEGDLADVPVAVRIADTAGTLADAEPVARFVIDRIESIDDVSKAVYLRDAHGDIDHSIARGVFLPNIPALAWRVQPAVIGAVASVPALPANSDGSVGFLSDAPLAEVSAVLDRGDPMEAGTWSLDPSQQQLLLEQPPAGPVVADVSTVGAGMTPATLTQALTALFGRIGKSAWSAADAQAIDAVTGYAGIGFYAGEAISVRAALAAILPSYGAWWWQDPTGVLRFARVTDPAAASPGSLAFDLNAADLNADLSSVADAAPNLSRRMAYRPNARILGAGELVSDLVDVPPWRRAELTSPWRGQVYSAAPLAPRYAHADSAAPLVSVFWRPQDAQAEIDRVCALYATMRRFFRAELRDAALAPAPGDIGRLTYPRYGLEAGRNVLVRAVQRNPATGDIVLTLWG